MKRLLFIVFLICSTTLFAQTSEKYNSDYANFYRAEELYQKAQYSAARKEFRNFIDAFDYPTDPLYVKALYYEGIAALELYNNDAVTLLFRFLRNYPESIYTNEIHFRLGKYYYQKRKYEDALSWLGKVEASDLDSSRKEEYFFKVGYAHFQEENFTDARSAFYEVKDGNSQYANPALYYFSHIEYNNKSYQTALNGFLKLEGDEKFGKVVPYYILQIYYLQGNYEKVTAYVPKLDDATVVNEKDINHLIGDAYYRIGKYDEAVPYLKKYNQATKTTRDDDYQLGYALLKSNDYKNAIHYLDRVGRKKDSLGQLAFYHIGECYLALDNPASSRSAFQQASEIDGDETVSKDALYQFAVLSYKLDVNPYNEAITAFEAYLEKYPNSERKNDVYQYLVNVYTSTSNYAKALESLDKLPSLDVKLKKAYQLLAYNYGIELYQKSKYALAIKKLALVNKFPLDAQLAAKALYWSADAEFMLENYSSSISEYRNFINAPASLQKEMVNDAYYNIGYAHLFIGDTILAVEAFRNYVQRGSSKSVKVADAYMRIADAYFMQRENEQAVKFYKKALLKDAGFQPQALYYLGFTQGVVGQREAKIANMQKIVTAYPSSKYVRPALYGLASTYRLQEQYSSALKYYNQLLNDFPKSTDAGQAKLDVADIYYKTREFEKAENLYLDILESYPNNSFFCKGVGDGLQNLYATTGQHVKLEQLATRYPCLEISNYTLENVLFSPALEAYDAKKYEDATNLFKKYLAKYPEGLYATEATIYTANSYYELENMKNAVSYYEQSLKMADNSYAELAASRVSKYYYNNEQYADAIEYYERLETASSDPEIIFNAKLGLTRCNFLTEDYEAAAAYAEQVLGNKQLSNSIQLEASYALGMSSFHLARFAPAIEPLQYVAKNASAEIGSESKLHVGQAQFNLEEYDATNTTVQELLKMKPKYDYWVAKGLILLSKVQLEKEELFQAEQTLRSVIDHYPIQDDGVLSEANAQYEVLMAIKSQPKSDVEEDVTPVIELNEEDEE